MQGVLLRIGLDGPMQPTISLSLLFFALLHHFLVIRQHLVHLLLLAAHPLAFFLQGVRAREQSQGFLEQLGLLPDVGVCCLVIVVIAGFFFTVHIGFFDAL